MKFEWNERMAYFIFVLLFKIISTNTKLRDDFIVLIQAIVWQTIIWTFYTTTSSHFCIQMRQIDWHAQMHNYLFVLLLLFSVGNHFTTLCSNSIKCVHMCSHSTLFNCLCLPWNLTIYSAMCYFIAVFFRSQTVQNLCRDQIFWYRRTQ